MLAHPLAHHDPESRAPVPPTPPCAGGEWGAFSDALFHASLDISAGQVRAPTPDGETPARAWGDPRRARRAFLGLTERGREGAFAKVDRPKGVGVPRSMGARMAVLGRPKGEKLVQTSGWAFWRFRDEDGDLKTLDHLRQRYLKQRDGRPIGS